MYRTLYVNRPVVNALDLTYWARQAGFPKIVTSSDLHVTIAFSRQPLEWNDLVRQTDRLTIEGGTRAMARLGPTADAAVLTFESVKLADRWRALRDAGASWDWDGYRPHITLSYDAPPDLDLAAIAPYDGPIILGPERFEEIEENWSAGVVEKTGQVVPFTGTFKAYGKLTTCKVDVEHGLVFGFAIVCKVDGEDYVDLQGDVITEPVMLRASLDFAKNSLVAKEMHVGSPTAKVQYLFPMTTEIAKALGITTQRTGLLVGYQPGTEALKKFISGEYTGFSIGGLCAYEDDDMAEAA